MEDKFKKPNYYVGNREYKPFFATGILEENNNMEDKFEKPSYYVGDRKIEPKDVISYLNCDFFLGNVIKYISRAGRKPGASFTDDISKALVYLNFEIDKLVDNYDAYKLPILTKSPVTDFWWDSIIQDWGFDQDDTYNNLCKSVMMSLYSFFTEDNEEWNRHWLDQAATQIDNWIESNKVTKTETRLATTNSDDYTKGWNDALEEVIEYLNNAHGNDTFASKHELIGHCEASKTQE